MSNNPAVVHYVKILRDAVTNPTKAYFFNSWNCANPKECRQYAISKLKTKFKYSDKAIMKLIDYSAESFDEQGFGTNWPRLTEHEMTEIIKIKPGKAEIGDPGLNESFKQWVRNNEYWTNLKYAKIFLDNMGLEYKIVENSDK